MKKLLFLLCCTLILSSTCKVPTLNLIVMLDYGDSEELAKEGDKTDTNNQQSFLGAITGSGLSALYEQTAPILISTSILSIILRNKLIFEDCLQLSASQLSGKYADQKITLAHSLGVFRQHCLYAQRMYESISKELNSYLSQNRSQGVEQVMYALGSKPRYLENSAPPTLRHYHKDQQSFKQALHRELQEYCLCAYAPLSTDHYCIKRVSPELTLLIPKHLIQSNPSYLGEQAPITPLEKILGIKVNHLPDITNIGSLTQKPPTNSEIPLTENFRDLFVTKEEGGSSIWTLYIAGHGLPVYKERREVEQLTALEDLYKTLIKREPNEKTKKMLLPSFSRINKRLSHTKQILESLPYTHEEIICSLPIEEFSGVLEFLNTEINTSLLFYTSCYAGGEHLITPYKHGSHARIFHYDIIVEAATDAVSILDAPMLLIPPYRSEMKNGTLVVDGITESSLDPHKRSLVPYTSLQFKKFFLAAQKPGRSPQKLMKLLQSSATKLENVAHYRPACGTTFTPLESSPLFFTAQTPSCTIPSSAEALFLTQQKYTSLSPARRVPDIVSLIPGPTMHHIDTMQASRNSLWEVVRSFLALESLSSPKVYWIKRLSCKKEKSSLEGLPAELNAFNMHEQSLVLHDVIIMRNVITSDGILFDTSTGFYFSDKHGTTWYCPFTKEFGSTTQVSRSLVHKELTTLFKNRYSVEYRPYLQEEHAYH